MGNDVPVNTQSNSHPVYDDELLLASDTCHAIVIDDDSLAYTADVPRLPRNCPIRFPPVDVPSYKPIVA